jgi:predicted DNA-binding transcriptional regulator AlpA
MSTIASQASPRLTKAIGEHESRESAQAIELVVPKEAASIIKMSISWLAKARMTGDGPTYIRIGRSIRYSKTSLLHWLKSRQRLSTSER